MIWMLGASSANVGKWSRHDVRGTDAKTRNIALARPSAGLAIDHDDVDSWADGSGGETCWHDHPAGLIV
jgi:hypothetical protein